MLNLGLNNGLPAQVLTDEEQIAQILENQKLQPLTRKVGGQFDPIPTKPPSNECRTL
jgi:hypothetical protein